MWRRCATRATVKRNLYGALLMGELFKQRAVVESYAMFFGDVKSSLMYESTGSKLHYTINVYIDPRSHDYMQRKNQIRR
jgi:hypothetical protein